MQKLRFALSAVIATAIVLSVAACAPAKLDITNVAGIIDTRPYSEYYKEHIVGSLNIDYSTGDFIALTTPLPKDGKYVIYGASDDEATAAAQAMFNRGYVDVTNVGTYENAKTVIDLPLVKNSNK